MLASVVEDNDNYHRTNNKTKASNRKQLDTRYTDMVIDAETTPPPAYDDNMMHQYSKAPVNDDDDDDDDLMPLGDEAAGDLNENLSDCEGRISRSVNVSPTNSIDDSDIQDSIDPKSPIKSTEDIMIIKPPSTHLNFSTPKSAIFPQNFVPTPRIRHNDDNGGLDRHINDHNIFPPSTRKNDSFMPTMVSIRTTGKIIRMNRG